MSNSRPHRNRVNKANQKEGRTLSVKEAKQMAFSLMAARQMNEELVAEKTRLKADLAKITKLLCAAALMGEGNKILISKEARDRVYATKPDIDGFYVRQPVDGEGVEVVAQKFEEPEDLNDRDWDPDEEDPDDEDPDIHDNEIPEMT